MSLSCEEVQSRWALPRLVNPTAEEKEVEVTPQDRGNLETDAVLYTISGHGLLKMPSFIPEKLRADYCEMKGNNYNILMADASGSMGSYWRYLMEGWNSYVAPQLKGRTSIYTFSASVRFIRSGTNIKSGDIDHLHTDLTSALMKIAEEVYQCEEKYVKIFLVTDGQHNSTKVSPEDILEKLQSPRSKIVDVFVLGIGLSFPVQYSIALRSLLHNGSSNLPALFWAKHTDCIINELEKVADYLSFEISQTLRLSESGFSLPGTSPKSEFHLGEWVYFPESPESLLLSKGPYSGQLTLNNELATMPVLNQTFRQWNNILIQLRNQKQQLPPEAIPMMYRLFKIATDWRPPKTNTIRERLAVKEKMTHEMEFAVMMNKLKAVLVEDRFGNDLDLAENILTSTVGGGKYQTKVLQLKGHTDEDFQKDAKEFLKVVEHQKESIMSITVTPEDCCRITLTSTLTDLQDQDLPELTKLNKFEFLKQFTISGIGVCAPMRDSVTINPWSFAVTSVLGQPYTIVSQVVMESIDYLIGPNKEAQLKADDVTTRFNSVVPIFSPEAAGVMKDLVQTRLYTMCATFAILKNPHMVDFNIHFAALGVVWVRLLHEYPTTPRPEHVQKRIQSIEATAELYVKRTGLTTYWRLLKEETAQALMTESTKTVEGRAIKCESLIKPMFILHLHMRQEKPDTVTLSRIIKMLLQEYIGRCLSKTDDKPFTHFFSEELIDKERYRQWVDRQLVTIKEQFGEKIYYKLNDFYRLEQVEEAARKEIDERLAHLEQSLTEGLTIALERVKVERLRSLAGAGDVSWPTLRTFVDELGLPREKVEELFSQESMVIYVVHALEYRSSRDRLATEMPDYQTAINKAVASVVRENLNQMSEEIKKRLVGELTGEWIQAYIKVHHSVVEPMMPTQIVVKARKRGIEVTEATFHQVYPRYRQDVGLLGNACQSRDCPFFLVPDCRFSQHLRVERRTHAAFPHAFHRTAYLHRHDKLCKVLKEIMSGSQSRSHEKIPWESVQPLADSLKKLMKWYRQRESSKGFL